MTELLEFFAVLGIKETFLWFLTVTTGVLVFDSWKGIIAQETFFKENKSTDVIHKKTNTTLLRDVLKILDTTTETNTSTIISFVAALLFCIPIFFNATEFVRVVSELMTMTVVITFILSRRSNRIHKRIKTAKPTVFYK